MDVSRGGVLTGSRGSERRRHERAGSPELELHRDPLRKLLACFVPPGCQRGTYALGPSSHPSPQVCGAILEADTRVPLWQRHTARRALRPLGDEHGFTVRCTILYGRSYRKPAQVNLLTRVDAEIGAVPATGSALPSNLFGLPAVSAPRNYDAGKDNRESICDAALRRQRARQRKLAPPPNRRQQPSQRNTQQGLRHRCQT